MEDFRDYNPYATPTQPQHEKTWVDKFLAYARESPLLQAIAEGIASEDEHGEGAGSSRSLRLFLFVTSGMMVLLVVYGLGRVIQTVVGKEIVMEKEVIIVEEVKLSDVLNEPAADSGDSGSAEVRSKKEKDQ